MEEVVLIGGGHAAAQFCASMSDAGAGARITMVTEEAQVPYQRPPLSKGWATGTTDVSPAWIRAETYYRDKGVRVLQSTRAEQINLQERTVRLSDGSLLPYGILVLAMGMRPRMLPMFGEHSYSNVHTLRNLDDARRLLHQLEGAQNVAIVGGGFIGLEVAASCAAMGKNVNLIEAHERLLSRSVAPEIASYLLQYHREAGVQIRLQTCVEAVVAEGQRITGLELSDGHAVAADLVLVAIGGQPNDGLAQASGLDCNDGIVVNGTMQTSDPHVYAIGDCTRFPSVHAGKQVRLESVQNANDQARCAAGAILGQGKLYEALPWFWSEQGSVRLQIAGLAQPHFQRVVRGCPGDNKFSVLYFEGEQLRAVESINFPADHMAARKLVSEHAALCHTAVQDASVPLKSVALA